MLPVRGMGDLGAVVGLVEVSRRLDPQSLTDEAPLLRLGLPQKSGWAIPLAWYKICIDPTEVTRTWTDPLIAMSATQIGTASSSSILYWRTLSQYSMLINNSYFEADRLMSGTVEIE